MSAKNLKLYVRRVAKFKKLIFGREVADSIVSVERLVRRILVHIAAGEVRDLEVKCAAWLEQAMYFTKNCDGVRQMLEEIARDDLVERALWKRVRKFFEIVNDVDARKLELINANSARIFGSSAAEIKYFW